MAFIIGCIVYILICKGICNMLEITSFNKQALVYALVGAAFRLFA